MDLYQALTNRRHGHQPANPATSGASDLARKAALGPDANGGLGNSSLVSTRAVVLAGGQGTRLAPYTSVLPKPLMPVGDRAILEIVVGQLAHLIRAVFEHQAHPDVEITYVHEEEPLGTAAPLRLVGDLNETFIVMNGDVLTTLDYSDLTRFHRESGNVLTIATHERMIKINYGLLHIDDASRLRDFEEKPEIVSPVSMGIYVMEPSVLNHIPVGTYFDFPDLVKALLRAHEPVGAYRFDGMWFDIGRREDYERAVAAWEANGNGARAVKQFA